MPLVGLQAVAHQRRCHTGAETGGLVGLQREAMTEGVGTQLLTLCLSLSPQRLPDLAALETNTYRLAGGAIARAQGRHGWRHRGYRWRSDRRAMPEFCVLSTDGVAGRAKTYSATSAKEAEQRMLAEFLGSLAAAIPLEELGDTTPAMALTQWLLTQPCS